MQLRGRLQRRGTTMLPSAEWPFVLSQKPKQ